MFFYTKESEAESLVSSTNVSKTYHPQLTIFTCKFKTMTLSLTINLQRNNEPDIQLPEY